MTLISSLKSVVVGACVFGAADAIKVCSEAFDPQMKCPGVVESDIFPAIEYYVAGDFDLNPQCAIEDAPYVRVESPTRRALCQAESSLNQLLEETMIVRSDDPSSIERMSRGLIETKTVQNMFPKLGTAIAGSVLSGGVADVHNAFCDNVVPTGSKLGTAEYCTFNAEYLGKVGCKSRCLHSKESLDQIDTRGMASFGSGPICKSECSSNPLSLKHFGEDLPLELSAETIDEEKFTYLTLYNLTKSFEHYFEYQFAIAQKEIEEDMALISTDMEAVSEGFISLDKVHVPSLKYPIKKGDYLLRDTEVPPSLIDGWVTERVLYTTENEGLMGKTVRFPFAAIVRGETGGVNENTVVIVMRRPSTDLEMRLNSINNLGFKHMDAFPGGIHEGGATVMMSVLPAAQLYFESTSGVDKIFIVGNSVLTSSAAAGASYFLSSVYPRVQISGVGFTGSPFLANEVFNNALRQMAEFRTILIPDTDSAAQCKEVFTCGDDLMAARTALGSGEELSYSASRGVVRLELTPAVNKLAQSVVDNQLVRYAKDARQLVMMHPLAVSECLVPCQISISFGCGESSSSCDATNCQYI